MVEFLIIIPLDEGDYKRMEQFMRNYGLKPSDALHVSTMSKNEDELYHIGRWRI